MNKCHPRTSSPLLSHPHASLPGNRGDERRWSGSPEVELGSRTPPSGPRPRATRVGWMDALGGMDLERTMRFHSEENTEGTIPLGIQVPSQKVIGPSKPLHKSVLNHPRSPSHRVCGSIFRAIHQLMFSFFAGEQPLNGSSGNDLWTGLPSYPNKHGTDRPPKKWLQL